MTNDPDGRCPEKRGNTMIYTVTLNPALDYSLRLETLRFDDVNRAEAPRFFYGGKGVNVAAVLTKLGLPACALGFVAGFTGDMLEALLREAGVDSDFIRLPRGLTRVNVKLTGDRPLEINAPGPAVDHDALSRLRQQLQGLQKGDWLVLSGSVPAPLPQSLYAALLRTVPSGVETVVDAAGDALLSALPLRPFLIKPNLQELDALFPSSDGSEADIIRRARVLQQKGARNVLVSRAEAGALLLDETGKVTKAENAAGDCVRTVGCGDSMLAGFLAGYLRTQSYVEALHLGTACGNAAAYCETLGETAVIDALLPQVRVRPINV